MILEGIQFLPDDFIRYLHDFIHIPYLLDEIRNYKKKEKINLYLGKDSINGYGLKGKYCLKICLYQENGIVNWKTDSMETIKQIANNNGIYLPKYSRRKNYIKPIPVPIPNELPERHD